MKEKELFDLGFKKSYYHKEYDYQLYDGTWFYYLRHEGYAYVLYKKFNMFTKPLIPFVWMYNKFASKDARHELELFLPVAHFRDIKRLSQYTG